MHFSSPGTTKIPFSSCCKTDAELRRVVFLFGFFGGAGVGCVVATALTITSANYILSQCV